MAFKTCVAALAAGIGLFAGALPATGQTPPPPLTSPATYPGDWPNLGAFNNRQGQNANPPVWTSGLTRLRYQSPSADSLNDRAVLTVDNTDTRGATGIYAFEPPLINPLALPATATSLTTGFVSTIFPNDASWGLPADDTKLTATNPFTLPVQIQAAPYRTQQRRPFYRFAGLTPSDRNGQPFDAADPTRLRYFEWTITPDTGASRGYSLYGYIPVGPTDVSGTGVVTPNYVFPQRYYVFRVFYGPDANSDGLPDRSFTDVVDTQDAESGRFFRIGNEGGASRVVFPSNGSRFVVRLYNTVPRFDNGALRLTGATPGLNTTQEQALADRYLVYADAVQAVPETGSIVASPTVSTVSGNAVPLDPTSDFRVTVARNFPSTLFDVATNATYRDTTPILDGTVINYEANANNLTLFPPGSFTPPERSFSPPERWRYSVVGTTRNGTNVDNPLVPGGTGSTANWNADTLNPKHIGTNYLSIGAIVRPNPDPAPITQPTATVNYVPTLADGEYAIYAYIPGNGGGQTYARSVEYRILQGNTVVQTVTVDQSQTSGWVRLGSQRFTNVSNQGDNVDPAPLSVTLTNVSETAGDNTRLVYADAVRFVGSASIGVTSTPVHATVNILQTDQKTIIPTKVVIVADESGKIHCLDLNGNPDGTTTEYWSYPSTPNPNDGVNYRDPNLVEGIDGVLSTDPDVRPIDNLPTAIMPSGFDLSTAVVARVGTKDLLYILSTNGRVYCIDTLGRGDFDAATHRVGSTRRQWTYPSDYPSTVSSTTLFSDRAAVRGSIVFGDVDQTGAAKPLVYVPAPEGRIYALDATGTPATARGAADTPTTTGVTSVAWRYPLETAAPTPPIQMTPTLFKPATGNGRLLFGTLRDPSADGLPGQFYCLDAAGGGRIWQINGPADDTTTADDDAVLRIADNTLGSFNASPVAVSGAVLDSVPKVVHGDVTGTPPAAIDTVYALNDNLRLYGRSIENGGILTVGDANVTHTYDQELSVARSGISAQSLAFSVISLVGRNGNPAQFPVIVTPTADGTLYFSFARVEDYSPNGDYFGLGRDNSDDIGADTTPTSVAAADNFLFVGDAAGRLNAYDQLGGAGGNLPVGFDTGVTEIPAIADPSGRPFRHLKVKLVNYDAYRLLRAVDPATGTGEMTYAQADATTANKTGSGVGTVGNPYAFEWGETAYVLVYGFPYATKTLPDTNNNNATQDIPPPQITVTFSVEGRVVRQIPMDSRQFKDPTSSPAVQDDPNGVGYVQDGYAIVPFPFQNSGTTSIPPGSGRITATLTTAAGGTSTTASEYIPDLRGAGTPGPIANFIVANPLAVIMGNNGPSIGNTSDGADEQNKVNGTPNVSGPRPGDNLLSQLQAAAPAANHGGSTTARVYVVDRSLMGLLKEDGIGNIRVQRTNLQRQGGLAGIYRPLGAGAYPGFEDKPINRPNNSLDYPDMGREQVRAIKDPEGNPENPIASGVTLRLPTAENGARMTIDNYSTGTGRRLVPTPFDLTVDIPRYQPPVNTDPTQGGMQAVASPSGDNPNDLLNLRHNSLGAILEQGYFGRVQVFVDSTGDSRLNTEVREAYRAFNLSTNVLPQLSILVGTPNVDLGSLAAGTGYQTAAPTAGGRFDPWTGIWSSVYKPMSVRNDGNVNLIDLRLAKATYDGTAARPWALTTVDNDPLAWMSAYKIATGNSLAVGDLWSNIDQTFSATNKNVPANDPLSRLVILPKPRVTDRVPSELTANPYPRANPNVGATGLSNSATVLDASKPSSPPKIGVSIPLGFPVGNYATQVRVVENFVSTTPPFLPIDNEVLEYNAAKKIYEAYSDPITLTYKVRETRMTNRATPNTAPVIDDPSLNTWPNSGSTGLGSDPFKDKASYRNAAPTALRDALGGLLVAWESDRALATSTNNLVAPTSSRLYLAGLANNGINYANGSNSPSALNSPLWDLGAFAPAGAQWFTKVGGAYPSDDEVPALFTEGGLVNSAPATFGSPSFPAAGSVDPLTAGTFGVSYLGFTGNALVTTGTNLVSESKVFVAQVTTGATPKIDPPIALLGDPLTAKGKPSVLQTAGNAALVFYSETSAGQSGISYNRVAGTTPIGPFHLGFGDGFSSVFSPSAVARLYRNDARLPIVEMSFAGKLRGRPNAEAYIGRMRLGTVGGNVQIVNPNGEAIEGTSANAFVRLPTQANERLVSEGGGVYRARGVAWNRLAPITLIQTVNGNSTVLTVDSTKAVERQSGIIAYDSRLGGKVYLDPELGIVRFAGAFPNRNADVRLTYTPTFLRVTPGGSASYSAINGLFDSRYVFDVDGTAANKVPYWFTGNGTYVNSDGNVSGATELHHDRYLFAYGRGAAGNGVTARPYMTTMRIGMRLPTRIATNESGSVVSIQVKGNAAPYQVDPANGRVYFQAADEDKEITVTYTGVNEATGQAIPQPIVVTANASFVLERDEEPIAVDEAANDSSLAAFLDPFGFSSKFAGTPRPPLVWLFYVSTRAGQPDLYFQTIAPRFNPFAR